MRKRYLVVKVSENPSGGIDRKVIAHNNNELVCYGYAAQLQVDDMIKGVTKYRYIVEFNADFEDHDDYQEAL